MVLTVDIGNTNIKVGAWDGDRLVFVSRLHTDIQRTSDEYSARFLDIFRLNGCNNTQFDGAILSSVVPPLSAAIMRSVEFVIRSKRVLFVSPDLCGDLDIKIENPSALGADLICAAVAAVVRGVQPGVCISLGTATAMFAIDKDANFLGGTVSPGISISLEALSKRTAQLPHISLENPGGIIGKNTVDAMKSGIVYGTASMLDGMIMRFREEMGCDIKCVAFGGHAPGIIKYCREKITINDNLVLEGLKILFDKNIPDIE